MLRTVSLLITAFLLACFPDAALADWSKLQTPHFLFVGDASEGQIRRTAQRLEQFRDVLGRALPADATSSPVPTVVIVFGSAHRSRRIVLGSKDVRSRRLASSNLERTPTSSL